jgi:transglutaminase-like putative cysteine protease
VKRNQVLAGFLSLTLCPAAALAAHVHHAGEFESVELQYLASGNPEQRRQLVNELKALAKGSSADDAVALNAAVSAMLPAVDSTQEAEVLMQIAAAHPIFPGGHGLPDDSEFLVDARQAAQAAKHATGDVEALADIRIDHLSKDGAGRDGLAAAHVQQVWRINTDAGARSFLTHSVMYAAMSETLGIVHARVLRSNGSEAAATVLADQPVEERGSSMYFDSRSRDLRFGQLQPGDLVELDYRLLPAAEINPWAGYYARIDLFRDGFATRLRRRVLIAPTAMKLYAVEHGVAAATVRQADEETIRVWEMHDIAAQPYEAMSPGASASGPYLHVSTIGTIQEFGRWYSRLLEPGLKLDENLQALADQIVARNLSTQGKVQAVYEAVQRRTKYVALEFGVHSYQPYALETVERRGFGDCKDKAAMIVALLRAVGVRAEFAMMRTRSAGDVAPDAFSVQLFNHAVAYVPELNLYLDGTAEYAALGELPPDDQGALAMTVSAEGNATRRTVPFSAPEVNRVTREVTAKLDPNGHLEFSSETKFDGYFAAEQRRTSQSDDLAGSTRASLAQFYPSIKIAHAVASGTARASREVELKVEGSIDVPQGERIVTLRSSLNTAGLTRKYASQRERRNPLLVPVTPSDHEVFDYELPEGAGAVLPADTSLQTAFGRVDVSYRREGQKLRVETYTELVPRTVEASDYGEFRVFCRAADEALQREFRIALP